MDNFNQLKIRFFLSRLGVTIGSEPYGEKMRYN